MLTMCTQSDPIIYNTKKEGGVTEKLLTEKQVSAIVSFKRTKIFKMIKAGEFPAPKKFSYVNRWLNSEIEDWLEELKKKD